MSLISDAQAAKIEKTLLKTQCFLDTISSVKTPINDPKWVGEMVNALTTSKTIRVTPESHMIPVGIKIRDEKTFNACRSGIITSTVKKAQKTLCEKDFYKNMSDDMRNAHIAVLLEMCLNITLK